MIGSNFITIILLTVLVIFGTFRMSKKKNVVESFAGLNVPMTYLVNRVEQTPSGFYDVPGNYQAMLSPRFSNLNYGAYIKYNMPSLKNQGVPLDPMGYGSLVGSNDISCTSGPQITLAGEGPKPMSTYGAQSYSGTLECFGGCGGGGCGSAGCRKGGGGQAARPLAGYSASNFVPANYALPSYKDTRKNLEYTNVQDLLPVGEMTTVSSNGEIEQPIVYDRLMFANQRSRLYGLGDPIRGDLPIVPCKTGWFRPSTHPSIDLRDGAMMVMGGINNDTTRQLLELQNAATAGLSDVGSGVNYTVQKSSYITQGGGDIEISAFP